MRSAGLELAVIPVAAPLIALLPPILLAIGTALVSMLKPSAVKALVKVLWRRKLFVLVFAGAVTGAVYASSYLFGGGPAAGQAQGGDDWAAYRGGPARTGAVPGSPDPVRGGAVWRFTRDVPTFYSSPAVVGNRVYVCSADKGLFTDRGAVYCLDADNGGVVWKYSPRGFRATYSSPAVARGRVVVGEGLHFTRDARINCLRADDGALVWEHRTSSHVESSPCIHGERVYIGAGDDGMYCIDLKPRSGGKANVVWHLDGKKYPDCETSPIVHDGKVYFGLGEGGHAVVCVDAGTGKEVWKVPTPYSVFSSPAIADGKLFVGMGNGNLVKTAEQLRDEALKKLREGGAGAEEIRKVYQEMAPAGKVWCLDPKTGAVLWRFDVDRNILGAIAVSGGRLYFGTQGGNFYCLNTDGQPIGRPWDARVAIGTSAAVGARHVYFITGAGQLYALDSATLRPKWEMATAPGKLFVSSPAVARGHVYVGTDGGGLICVGHPPEGESIPVFGGHLGGPGSSGWADGSVLSANGERAWRFPAKGAGASGNVSLTVPPAWLDDAVYLAVSEGDRVGLAKVVQKGSGRRASAQEAWFYATPNAIHRSAAVRGGTVLVVDGKPGDPGRHLHCLSAADGKRLWRLALSEGASGEMVVTEHHLYVYAAADTLSCIRLGHPKKEPERHEPLWQARVGSPVGMPAVVGDAVLAAGASPPAVIAFAADDGAERWRARLARPPVVGCVAQHGLVAVGTERGLTVLSMAGRAPVWTAACGRPAAPLVCNEGYLACSTSEGLWFFDWSGEPVMTRREAVAGVAPMLLGEMAVYAAAGAKDDTQSIEQIHLAKGQAAKPRRWMRAEEAIHGQITTTPVLANSCLFFGTSRRGLICARPR